MKRFQIGVILLLTLLGCALWTEYSMNRQLKPVADALDAAASAALSENWEEAEEKYACARKEWEASWNATAALADHQPLEDIDGLMGQLSVFLGGRDSAQTAALCRELRRRILAVADAQTLHWRNLL